VLPKPAYGFPIPFIKKQLKPCVMAENDCWASTLNPQVLGSNPRGRTFSQVRGGARGRRGAVLGAGGAKWGAIARTLAPLHVRGGILHGKGRVNAPGAPTTPTERTLWAKDSRADPPVDQARSARQATVAVDFQPLCRINRDPGGSDALANL
jgi:hypothetical protein